MRSGRRAERPRVCIVRQQDVYEPGLRREAEALRGAGYDVEVICMRDAERPRKTVINGVEITSLPTSVRKSSKLRYVFDYASFGFWAGVLLAWRHLRRPYAVVQVNTMPDFLVFAALVPKLLGARVIIHMKEPSPELAETLFGRGWLISVFKRIEQLAIRFADQALTVTEQLKQRYVERGARADKITVVLTGNPEVQATPRSLPTDVPKDSFTLICHGTIEDRYGHQTIVEAAALLHDELPDLRLVFTGRGSGEKRLLEMIEEFDIQDVTRHEGWVTFERLSELLAAADVGVVAQKASSYSHLVHTNKMVDYWVFGLPVIASRLRAVSELYDDSVLEYYEPDDARSLAQAIRRLCNDPVRREELARNGKIALERNGWPVQQDIYLGVYDEILGGMADAPTPTIRATHTLPRLDRLLQPLNPVQLECAEAAGPPEWLVAGAWRLLAKVEPAHEPSGELIERFRVVSGGTVDAVYRSEDGTVHLPFDPDEAYQNYVTEAWRAHVRLRALSLRQLRLYYRVKSLLPRAFWLQLRRSYIRRGGLPEFPAWPLEGGVDSLLRFYAHCLLVAADADEAPFAWFWPGDHRAALILTHDIESAAGLRLAIELADLEEERGLRSSFNIVWAEYPIDRGILRELKERGFEIGLHGLRHDRSLFSSRREFERQLPQLAEAAAELGSEGFRSPATYRISEWLHELPAAYDCSVPHSDPHEPQPGGCCSIWPYMLGEIVELPYTLAQDHTLFTLLGQRSAAPWLQQLDAIEERFGLIQCVSHPDLGYVGDPDKQAFYVEFLDAIADRDRIWKALPRTVANWWRRRDARETESPEQLTGTIRREDPPQYASFEPPPIRS